MAVLFGAAVLGVLFACVLQCVELPVLLCTLWLCASFCLLSSVHSAVLLELTVLAGDCC